MTDTYSGFCFESRAWRVNRGPPSRQCIIGVDVSASGLLLCATLTCLQEARPQLLCLHIAARHRIDVQQAVHLHEPKAALTLSCALTSR